ALLLGVMTGEPIDLVEGVRGLRIGVVDELFSRADPAVAAEVHAAVDELRSLGAKVEHVEIPLLEEAGTITQLLLLPEAAEVHLPWMRTQLADYGDDVRARLLAGLLLPATAHVTGLRARRWFCGELSALFDRVDLLAAPAMPVVAPTIGEDGGGGGGGGGHAVALPPRADPVQLALGAGRPPRSERAGGLRRGLAGRPGARRPAARRDDRPPGRAYAPARHRLARAAATSG